MPLSRWKRQSLLEGIFLLPTGRKQYNIWQIITSSTIQKYPIFPYNKSRIKRMIKNDIGGYR